MKITSINIKPVQNAPAAGMVARLSMTIDNAIAVRGLRILKREDGSYGLGMAARKRRTSDKYDEFYHPITQEFRKVMEDTALAAYEKAMAETDKQDSYIYDLDEVEANDALNITDIRFRFNLRTDALCKAFVSVALDNGFVLHQIHLLEHEDGTKTLGMPNFPTRGETGDRVNVFHPISAAARIKLTEAILEAYESAKAKHDEQLKAEAAAVEKAE